MSYSVSDTLYAMVKNIEKNLEQLSVEEFLEGVLEIKRIQSLTSKGWETLEYELLVTFGGPNIYIRTSNIIEGYWYADYVFYTIRSEKAKAKLREIEEYLDGVV